MYKNLALINGIILSIMIFFNGVLSQNLGPYVSTLVFHLIGFFTIITVLIIKRYKITGLINIPISLFLPGVFSVLTVFLSNLCIPKIGVTATIGLNLYGQFIISAVIDHFGLFGMPIEKLKRENSFSLLLISTGIIFIVLM